MKIPAVHGAKTLPMQPGLSHAEPVRFQVVYLVVLTFCAHLAADIGGSPVLAEPAQSTSCPVGNLLLCKAGEQADYVQLLVDTPVGFAVHLSSCLQTPYSIHRVRQPPAAHQQGHQSTGIVPPVSSPAFKQPFICSIVLSQLRRTPCKCSRPWQYSTRGAWGFREPLCRSKARCAGAGLECSPAALVPRPVGARPAVALWYISGWPQRLAHGLQ